MPRAQLCLDTDLRNFCLVLSSCAWWVLLRYHGRGQVLGAAGALNLFYQGLPPYTSLLFSLHREKAAAESVQMNSKLHHLALFFSRGSAFVFSPSLLASLLSSISQAAIYHGSLKSCLSLETPLRNQAEW